VNSIIVFDSGGGGLTVAAEIAALLPAAALTYVGDNGFFPYGIKGEAELIERVDRVVCDAVARVRPAAVVIACNTASTVVLPRLRSHLEIPVVGVVPAVKPAAALSGKRVIGLLGTPGTVSRTYTQDLIERFAAECTVLRVGSAELCQIAERLLEGEAPSTDAVARVLAPFFDRPLVEQPDVVVLACTHFPLLKEALSAVAPPGVAFIDSGRAVAERVRVVLDLTPDLMAPLKQAPRRAFFTRDDAVLRRKLPAFAAYGFDEVEFLVDCV
jgi:glutamate racemase